MLLGLIALPTYLNALPIEIDMTDYGDEANINEGLFSTPDSSEGSVGSGNIQSFVRWQGKEETAGFNTDAKINPSTTMQHSCLVH